MPKSLYSLFLKGQAQVEGSDAVVRVVSLPGATGAAVVWKALSGEEVVVLSPSFNTLFVFCFFSCRSRIQWWLKQWWLWIWGWSQTCHIPRSLWNSFAQYRRVTSTGELLWRRTKTGLQENQTILNLIWVPYFGRLVKSSFWYTWKLSLYKWWLNNTTWRWISITEYSGQ